MVIAYDKDTKKVEYISTEKLDRDNCNYMEVEEADIPEDVFKRLHLYRVDDKENFYIDKELVKEYDINQLRTKREPLLKAFDIYKSNLIVGAISLSDKEKQQVIEWYHLILNLDEDAINNPPSVISKYL